MFLATLVLTSCLAPEPLDDIYGFGDKWGDWAGYHWITPASHEPIDNIQYQIWDREVFKHFVERGSNPNADAFALRDYENNTCIIVSPDRPLEPDHYLDWHERKHCAGYDHKEP